MRRKNAGGYYLQVYMKGDKKNDFTGDLQRHERKPG